MWMLHAVNTCKSGPRDCELLLAGHAGRLQQPPRCSNPGLMVCTQELRQIRSLGKGASGAMQACLQGLGLPSAVPAHAMA